VKSYPTHDNRQLRFHDQVVKASGRASPDSLKTWLDPADAEDSELAARCIALRILGHSMADIRAETGVKPHQLLRFLRVARERQELQDIGPVLDHVALPLAVDNLVAGLEAGDQKYTLATLGGRGAFSKHSKSETANTDVKLEIHVEMPDRIGAPVAVIDGQVVGVPRQVKDDAG
jgi:hypothetical protein